MTLVRDGDGQASRRNCPGLAVLWGEGSFESDGAADFLDSLEELTPQARLVVVSRFSDSPPFRCPGGLAISGTPRSSRPQPSWPSTSPATIRRRRAGSDGVASETAAGRATEPWAARAR
ncbi:hypothetical protein DRA43_07280 [Micromonospora provocatoris]|nr:hypothetical protein DRA43_07280 [Micromonospora provocatoris]